MSVVIGTAGHIDHGKTTLVRALTGVETDRLPDEKRRGITIDIGFAKLRAGDESVSFVDVPGHERFVRQMIAGAVGVDLVLLIVAADEGVMPQTREHLDICELLGVRAGAVVVTKTDLVDADWLELVREDVRAAVRGTFLDGAPVVGWAAGDPAADERVKAVIAALVAAHEKAGRPVSRDPDRPFKLSVDRAFTMRGFGTVVTGTTASGTLSVGDTVVLQPTGQTARVRGIQVHGEAAERVGPGVRAALNLQGLDADDVHRGAVVTTAPGLEPALMIDATFLALRRLPGPVADRTKVLVHVGTAQVEGTLALLGADAVAPGERAAAQLRLAQPVAILPGEPYILRGFSILPGYGKTLGGGRALAPDARRRRRTSDAAASAIAAVAGDDIDQAVLAWVTLAELAGRARAGLPMELPWPTGRLDRAVDRLVAARSIDERSGQLWAVSVVRQLAERARDLLTAWHAEHPTRPGLRDEELRTRLYGELPPELFAVAVSRGRAMKLLARTGEHLHAAGFTPRVSATESGARDRVRDALAAGELMPPRVQDLPEALGLTVELVDEAVQLLVEEGEAVRVTRELVYLRGPLDALERRMREHFAAEPTLDTTAFKDMTGATRKWVIPLSEYFDRIKVTVRVGDLRRLRGGR